MGLARSRRETLGRRPAPSMRNETMASSGNSPAVVADAPGTEVLLRRLTASLAHNVNNALTGVIGYLELALRRPEAPAEVGACVRSGLECAHQAADAVRRIVGCARRISDAEPPAPHSLRRLAEEAADRLARETQHASAAVVGATAGPVVVSAGLVALALDALLGGVAAAEGVGTLRLADEDGRCVLTVEGGGAARSDLPLRLLEASLMIEIQGGAVDVLSTPGKTAAVRLSLPRRGETPLRRDDAQSAPPAPHLPAALGLLRQAV